MRRTLASLCLVAFAACTDDLAHSDALFVTSDMSGSLTIPLDGRDAEGHAFRLRAATFEVNGSAMMTLTKSADKAQRELKAPLPSGSYQVFLRPGFELVSVASDGSEQPVSAQLSSANPGLLQLSERSDRALGLVFQVGSGRISFGAQSAPRWARGAASSILASAPSSP